MVEPDEVASDGTEANISSNYRQEEAAKARVHQKWTTFKSSFQETAEEVLGWKEKSNKPWISHNSWTAIDDRKKLKHKIEVTKSERIKDQLRKDYKEKDKETKRSIRRYRRKWIDDLIREAEEAANKGQMKTVYDITKIVCNCKSRQSQAVRDKSGQLLTSEDAKLERWRQHFEETLNQNKHSVPLDVQEDECIPELVAISQEPINKEEIKAALKSMKSGKAPGRNSITAELLKADKDLAAEQMEELFKVIWEKEVIPDEWKKGIIVKIPKKGDLTVCDNYRGITLLCVPSKVFTRTIINRLYDEVNKRL